MRAALVPGSVAGRPFAVASEGRARVVGSPETLQEAARVLARPKFAARLPSEALEASVARLVAAAEAVEPVERDDMVLEAAPAAAARETRMVLIVSDDEDLLVLDPWRGVRVLKPEAALALLGEGTG